MNGYRPGSNRMDGYRSGSDRMDTYGPASDRLDGHVSESGMASKYNDIENRDSDRSVVSLDSQGKKKSFGRVIERFAEKTSMQGVPYINLAKLRCAKITWTILLLCAIAMMVLHLYYLCNQFFLWPKTTVIELGFNNLQLPAVTICNVNIIRNTQLRNNKDSSLDSLRQLTSAVDPTKLDPKQTGGYTGNQVPGTGTGTGTGTGGGTGTGTGTGTGPGQTGKRRRRSVQTFKDIDLGDYGRKAPPPKDTDVGPRDAISDIEDTFTDLYMSVDRDLRVDIGHTIDDMLVSCAFNGQTCYTDNFTLFQTPTYGNCYTIESPKFVSKKSGPSKGLKLILYVDNQDYIKGITQGYGARVTLHYPGTIPDPADRGFYISTAFETDIGLKLVDIHREGQPYGVCTDGLDFEQKYKRKYTRQACLNTCVQEAMLSRCGCYALVMQEVFYQAGRTSERVCNTTAELDCEAAVEDELDQKTIVCTCPNPCVETQYVTTFSTRQWPTEDYSTVLVQTICEADNRTADCRHLAAITDKTELSTNFLKLIVYYEDLNYEKIAEAPEIETAQFASDVGGAIGLWIGLSMLSMFEVVQLIVELCGYGVSKCNKDEAKKERARRKRQQRRRRIRDNEYVRRYGAEADRPRHDGVHADYRVNHSYGPLPDYREEYINAPNHSMNGFKEVDGYLMYKGHSRTNSEHGVRY